MSGYALDPPWGLGRRHRSRRRSRRGSEERLEMDQREGRRHRHGPPWEHQVPPDLGAMFGPGFGHGPGGWWGGFGPWRGPGRRRGGARRGDVRVAILALLVEQPMHGYQIIQEIGRRSNGVWTPSPGAVYPALAQLEDEGLVRMAEEGGRKVFHLTEEGQAYVASHTDEATQPWDAALGSVPDAALDARAVIGQLAMAYLQAIQTGDPALTEQARQVLLEARRALYRLLAGDTGPGEPPTDEENRV
jgi:DNA-binding PadR family transcriptional regulator